MFVAWCHTPQASLLSFWSKKWREMWWHGWRFSKVSSHGKFYMQWLCPSFPSISYTTSLVPSLGVILLIRAHLGVERKFCEVSVPKWSQLDLLPPFPRPRPQARIWFMFMSHILNSSSLFALWVLYH